MKVFINNIRIKIKKHILDKPENEVIEIDPSVLNSLNSDRWVGDISCKILQDEVFVLFINWFRNQSFKKLKSVTIFTKDIALYEELLKKAFKTVKAAGGIVEKNGRILLIHRLGTWDLPKGKIENGEPSSECAVREIEEECGVVAKIEEKLVATWHTYSDKEKPTIKKTTWYIMSCLSDKNMKPQKEESITDIRWVTLAEAEKLLKNSYASIQFVLSRYKKLKALTP